MDKLGLYWRKFKHRLKSFWLQPIRVYCFHQVGGTYHPQFGAKDDWMETKRFQKLVMTLKGKYTFISMAEAEGHLRHDIFRFKKYAVLTSDDGYQSVLEVLPWLEEQKVPITLFLSVGYLDGVSHDPWFDKHWESFANFDKDEWLRGMYIQYCHLNTQLLLSANVTLALHGYGHDEVSRMDANTFSSYVDSCMSILKDHPRFQPFYAYTWGHHSKTNDRVLQQKGLIPVYCDGIDNGRFNGVIHRVLLDEKPLMK